jgi:hypothetical protein
VHHQKYPQPCQRTPSSDLMQLQRLHRLRVTT